jgi:hypothetical protein
MCFSAEASFTVGAVLLPVGAYCVQAAIRKRPGYLGLAALPLFFGVQQIMEGFVWVGLNREDAHLVRLASLGFLFFALGFWPFWVPFSAFLIEERPARKTLIGVLALLSLVWMFALFGPVAFDPERWLTTKVVHHSIYYDYFDMPLYHHVSPTALRLLYLATIAVPFVIGSNRDGAAFGVVLIASAVFSHFVYAHAFVSVWCFFAAAMSAYLAYVFYALDTDHPAAPAHPPEERNSTCKPAC